MQPAALRPVSSTPSLLRYRFDSIEQAQHHLHENDRVLFFYPSLFPLRPGEVVILEIGFTHSDQHCTVRGAVVGNGGAAPEWGGSWLELDAHDLVAKLESATATPKRRHRRYSANVLANVQLGGTRAVVARVADIGFRGARLVGASMQGVPGDLVQMTPFGAEPATALRARLAWMRGVEAGVEFVGATPAERALIASLVQAARDGLTVAYEASHPVICRCTAGEATLEPPIPSTRASPRGLTAGRQTEQPSLIEGVKANTIAAGTVVYAVEATEKSDQALRDVPGLRERAFEMLQSIVDAAREIALQRPTAVDPDAWLRLHVGGSVLWYTLDVERGVAVVRAVRLAEEESAA